METLLTFIKQIAIYMLLLSFLLSLLPDGAYKPIIRTIGGIMMLLSCISQLPLLDEFSMKISSVFDSIAVEQNLEEWQSEMEKSSGAYQQSILKESTEMIETKLKEQLKDEQYTVTDVDLAWDAKKETFILQIVLKSTNGKKELFTEYSQQNQRQTLVVEKLKTYISDFYPIAASNINITIQR